MGDNRRHLIFTDWIHKQFPLKKFPRILEVACGTGKLSEQLTRYGYQVTGYDIKMGRQPKSWKRCKREDAGSIECDLVIGMHPDEATESIIRAAIVKQIPFAIVPCCVMPEDGLHRSPDEWENHLVNIAKTFEYEAWVGVLNMSGKNRVIKGWPKGRR